MTREKSTKSKKQNVLVDTMDEPERLLYELAKLGGNTNIKNGKISFDVKGRFVCDLNKMIRTLTLVRDEK